jgi:hypothetical protein
MCVFNFRLRFRHAFFIGTYLIGVTAMLYWILSKYGYDDPFITYRYAIQLAQGHGFVYNPGEYVLSTTTPLFALLLAAGSFAWPNLPHLAIFIGCLSTALGGLSLWIISRAWQTHIAGWVGLFLYPTFTLVLSVLGSETPLYLALCLGAVASYAHRRYPLAAALAALAVLTRPDGILVAAVLALHYLIVQRGRIPWTAAGLFAGILLPWFIFSWFYFGSLLPATLAVKQHQGSMAISQRFAAGFLTVARPYASQWVYRFETCLAVVGLIYLIRRARSWGVLISWTVLYFVAYSALGVSRYFWYYAPLVPGFVGLVGLGVELMAETVNKILRLILKKVSIAGANRRIITLAALLTLPLFLAQSKDVWQMQTHIDKRLEVYRLVGEWLQANTPVNAAVGTLEVGIIGYYAQRTMIDFAGLIQPEVATHLTHDATYEDAALWAVSHYTPQYLVLHDGLFPRLEQGYAAERCQSVKTISGKDYGYNQNMTIYACR